MRLEGNPEVSVRHETPVCSNPVSTRENSVGIRTSFTSEPFPVPLKNQHDRIWYQVRTLPDDG